MTNVDVKKELTINVALRGRNAYDFRAVLSLAKDGATKHREEAKPFDADHVGFYNRDDFERIEILIHELIGAIDDQL